VAVLAPPALAYQCEAFITLLDQKMADQELSEEQMAELRRLRDEGQRLHEQGRHEASMEALERAGMMLVPARFSPDSPGGLASGQSPALISASRSGL
jgi:hypothetical protein